MKGSNTIIYFVNQLPNILDLALNYDSEGYNGNFVGYGFAPTIWFVIKKFFKTSFFFVNNKYNWNYKYNGY